jgi:hypothetical protein
MGYEKWDARTSILAFRNRRQPFERIEAEFPHFFGMRTDKEREPLGF